MTRIYLVVDCFSLTRLIPRLYSIDLTGCLAPTITTLAPLIITRHHHPPAQHYARTPHDRRGSFHCLLTTNQYHPEAAHQSHRHRHRHRSSHCRRFIITISRCLNRYRYRLTLSRHLSGIVSPESRGLFAVI